MEISHVFTLIGLLLKVTTVHFAFIVLRWIFCKPSHWAAAPPVTRFAIVIAARNEQAVIGRLVSSLLSQNYPKDLFDIYVVPNNCTDHTANAAFRAGANLLLCDDPVRQKGDALRQAFCQLEGKGYDAFLVFDADNVVDGQYLQKTNDAFCAGARVVKGRHAALNPSVSWVSGCYDLYFAGFDLLFNQPRANGSLSAKLIGTGFAVHRTVLEQLGGWNTGTIAEDAEFSAQCAMAGIRICWAPDALTYDEEPSSFFVSLHQRKRWCSGVMQVGRTMIPRLMGQKMSALRWDMLLFFMTAQLQPVSALLLTVSWHISIMESGFSFWNSLLMLMLYWFGCTVFGAMLSLLCRTKERHNWRAVALFPIFMASWVPLQVLALFKNTTHWREIRHGIHHTDCKARKKTA